MHDPLSIPLVGALRPHCISKAGHLTAQNIESMVDQSCKNTNLIVHSRSCPTLQRSNKKSTSFLKGFCLKDMDWAFAKLAIKVQNLRFHLLMERTGRCACGKVNWSTALPFAQIKPHFCWWTTDGGWVLALCLNILFFLALFRSKHKIVLCGYFKNMWTAKLLVII